MRRIIVGLTVCVFCAASFGGDAVSDLNGKVGVFAGDMNGDNGINFDGSVSYPLGDHYGVQLDGYYTDVSDRDFYGLGGHLFWRDSEVALLGVTAGAVRENEVLDSWLTALEGEYYMDRLTVNAQAGLGNIDYTIGPMPFIETDATKFYGNIGAGFYVTEDLRLSIDGVYAFDNLLARGQLEYQTHYSGLTFVADLAYGEYDYHHATVGLRYYFGKKKSLILRHREDDPPNMLHSMMNNIGTYGAEFNSNMDDYLAKHGTLVVPGSGGGGSGGSYGLIITVIGGDAYGSELTVEQAMPTGSVLTGGGALVVGSAGSGGNALTIGTISSGGSTVTASGGLGVIYSGAQVSAIGSGVFMGSASISVAAPTITAWEK